MGRSHCNRPIDRADARDTAPPRVCSTGRLLGALAVSAALLVACAGDDDASSPAAPEAAPVPAEPLAADVDGPGAPRAGGLDLGRIGRDVIVEVRVQMETDDIARTVAAITTDAVNAGGGVASSDISYGATGADGEPNRDGYAVLVVKVPPAEVSPVLDHLSGTGRVTSVNQSAQDVTDQLVDLDVRIENQRESVANVRRMMDDATDLGQLVQLEAELTSRLTTLEQLEAQARNLSDRVAMATITIEVRPTRPAAEGADEASLGDAFRDGWGAFVAVLFGIAYVVAATAPFLAALLIAGGAVWLATRLGQAGRRSRTATPSDGADANDDELTRV